MDRMADWITSGERPLPFFVSSFAKSASGGKSRDEDDSDDGDDDEEDDDSDDEDEDEDEDDDLADLSEKELRAELKKTRDSLTKAGGSVKSKRARIRKLNRELEEARKPQPKAKSSKKDGDDDDAPDLDLVRSEAKAEGEKAGTLRAKRSEAKAALVAAGVSSERVGKAVGLIDLDELELDDDGLDGIDDAIDDLRKEWPELFATKRRRRSSVAGDGDRDGDRPRRKPLTASEKQAALVSKGR